MDLDASSQENFYEKYWYKIEKNILCDSNNKKNFLNNFIKDYLTIKQENTISENRLYFEFKNYFNENNINNGLNIENLLKDMYKYSMLYKTLLHADSENRPLNAIIKRLNKLNFTVIRPFLMEVLKQHEEGSIDENDTEQIFAITEIYIFRRIICASPSNILNRLYATMNRDIIELDGTVNNYLNKYISILLNKKEKEAFPNDEEFKNMLSSKNIYSLDKEYQEYIFERLENMDTKEDKDIYRHFENKGYSVEHIMPQTLTENWKKELGDNYQNIYDKWLNRLANLTMTAYNSKYSNRSFNEKKNMEKGYKNSGIRLNQYISKFNKWTEEELEERNEDLLKQALKFWKLPTTTYELQQKEVKRTVPLSEEDESIFTNKKIESFYFLGLERKAKDWIDMYTKVLKILLDKDDEILYQISHDNENKTGLNKYISCNQENFRRDDQLNEKIYVEKNISNTDKIRILKKLFDMYNIDYSDLEFVIK